MRTNFPPFQAYAVEGWWLDALLKGGKLTRQVYLGLASRVCVGFQKRHADVLAAERYEREQAAELAVMEMQDALKTQMNGVKAFPVVSSFVSLFADGCVLPRRPVLVIVGATNLGKSLLLASGVPNLKN